MHADIGALSELIRAQRDEASNWKKKMVLEWIDFVGLGSFECWVEGREREFPSFPED